MKRTSAISGPAKTTKKTRTTVVKKKTLPRYNYVPTKVYLGKQPLPLQLFNTVKYAESVVVTLIGGFNSYLFSCNSLFDPNRTGTGHQPMYFDQLIALYDHYTVLRSRIKFSPLPGGLFDTPFAATVYQDDDATVATTFTQALEQKSACKAKTWIPQAGPNPTLYSSWDAAKTFGPNPQAQDSLQGDATASPTEQTFYTLCIQDLGSSNNTISLLVEVEYDTVWDELKTQAQS